MNERRKKNEKIKTSENEMSTKYMLHGIVLSKYFSFNAIDTFATRKGNVYVCVHKSCDIHEIHARNKRQQREKRRRRRWEKNGDIYSVKLF